ncbi:MAG: YbbR-like domain-containing protein [Acidobacteria bacterium]|nr:YbbR-like domain-containing protein [Acidobacteriota bacterium]
MATGQTTKDFERGGVTRRWLRALFLEDWTLKALALLITLGLWYAVTTQRAPATKRLHEVPLEFLLTDGVAIGNDPVDKVDVLLAGSQDKLAVLTARDLVAQLDLTGLLPGDRNPRLTEKNVSMELPEGVSIREITPRSLTLHLEPVTEREVPVEARFEGEPPPGFVRGAVTVAPERTRVRGPQSHVNAVERAYTETISLALRREPLALPQVAIDIPDHKVVPLDATVSVRVEIGEEQSEQRFTNVAVKTEANGPVSPATATVTLRGPRSVVQGLRPEDVRLVVTPGEDGRIAAHLALPPNAQGRVELVNTSPSEFTLNR